jgi:hypothetical protein
MGNLRNPGADPAGSIFTEKRKTLLSLSVLSAERTKTLGEKTGGTAFFCVSV